MYKLLNKKYFCQNSESFFGLSTSIQFGSDFQNLLQTISRSTSNVMRAISGLEVSRTQLDIPEVEPAKNYLISFREHTQVLKSFVDKLASQVVDTQSNPEDIFSNITTDLTNFEYISSKFLESAVNLDKIFHSNFVSLILPTAEPSFVFVSSIKNILFGVRSLGTRKQIAAVDVNGILKFTDVHAIATYLFSFNTTLNQILAEIQFIMIQLR